MELRKAILAFLLILLYGGVKALSRRDYSLVEKSERRPLVVSEYGTVSAVDVQAGHGAPLHHLQFITLEPNSLFLPVLLHADMLLYVHTGSGRLTSADEDGTKSIDLRVGDLCKLDEGTVFHIQSNSQELTLYAMFANSDDHTYDPSIGAYSRVNELIKGFDKRIIQAAFQVPEDLVEAITKKSSIPGIVHSKNATSEEQHAPKDEIDLEASLLGNILGIHSSNKEKTKYNIFKHDPDFRNRHGWTLTVTKKQLKALKHTNLGFLMVNLTAGSMLGPHWNPRSAEIAVVLYGRGMVRVLCGSSSSNDVDKQRRRRECKNRRFKVEEGEVFVVPRYHAMAQMSFQNESLVFLGFTTSSKKHTDVRFLAGDTSVLQNMNRDVLATSLGVSNATVGRLLRNQNESVIFACNSCAEEERRREEEEDAREKEREEEEDEKERKRQEEEEEEEEARRREEEEAARRREEEERERAEEEERRREEEKEKEKEEEDAREKEREEEERERKRQEEEEEARTREEEERARRREEKERERKRQEEEEEARRREEARRERERRREEEEERGSEAERAQEEARKERQRRREEEEIERERQEEERRREFERRRQEAAERERQEEGGEREGKREGGGGGGYHVPVETQVEGRRVLKARHV
ncbi:vicilin-like seed storage protein At2g18540 [Arachis stenosperma]|uniref:vicilin-like seed storage protein At2g18540 n=1 Tax=Arachis stenosperma TaxID=217475 RepID=UPI0025AC16A9|nr:vicilin-like seed storage protein At2g18540 [Arachis stenosperma]